MKGVTPIGMGRVLMDSTADVRVWLDPDLLPIARGLGVFARASHLVKRDRYRVAKDLRSMVLRGEGMEDVTIPMVAIVQVQVGGALIERAVPHVKLRVHLGGKA